MAHLSKSQQKVITERRKPIRHAMDRLIERYMPDADDEYVEIVITMMTSLCELRAKYSMGQTSKLVSVESPSSVIIDLDMFEDREVIRVCYDPIENRIRTVLPKVVECQS